MTEPLIFRRDDRDGASALLAQALSTPGALQQLSKEELGVEIGPRPAERRRLLVLRTEAPVSTAAIRPAGDFIGVVVTAARKQGGDRLAPVLSDRGLRLPTTWRLLVDVRDMAGWLVPKATAHRELVDCAMAAVEAADGIGHPWWRARVRETGPLLPGFYDRR